VDECKALTPGAPPPPGHPMYGMQPPPMMYPPPQMMYPGMPGYDPNQAAAAAAGLNG